MAVLFLGALLLGESVDGISAGLQIFFKPAKQPHNLKALEISLEEINGSLKGPKRV
jgi:hypothetical protein